ncbi:hypothetical protein MJO28_011958 [Puccinia striiformis f. sp. tritici]|uniref:NADP-dependent oxidoreductase domain-containing protein n=2 Tax=Puccinia striiformis f. sp. tritici TaxID=168172 RepID=A0A0L0VDF3_9BASI|nr:hypothetical protein MJO28_011958 [Puccinia striiformis f. sp. tritici]KAI7946150.1 hypothetical protein MJO29_012538 [Puccinia striiformis f. sp. tritici]KNE97226.1 hypothetical protein PSTG_09488 [Puccinia striiformis f. sp. tritici PST-78]
MAIVDITSQRHVGHESSELFPVSPIGYGLMRLTWAPNGTPDEKAFETILAFLNGGGKFLDSGEFYGNGPDRIYANLELLARFFDAYPEWAEEGKVFLSVKGGINLDGGKMNGPDGSMEALRKSVHNINQKLGGKKKMDLFQMARVDVKVPIEDVMKTYKILIKEGKFKHVGLSEVSAETIRRAHTVHPISAVEVEYSPWLLDIEHNGILSTCEELRIPIVAYSPLGLGLLTGKIKSLDDLEPNDMRRHFDRFLPENFHHNIKLTEKFTSLAEKKGCTSVQLALAWILNQSKLMIPIPGSTRSEGVQETLDTLKVKLSEEDVQEIREFVDKADIKGLRYSVPMDVQDQVN